MIPKGVGMLSGHPVSSDQRLVAAARQLHPALPAAAAELLTTLPGTEPNRISDVLVDVLGPTARRVVLTGTLERRLLALEPDDRPEWTFADLAGRSHQDRDWPDWAHTGIQFIDPGSWLSQATVSPAAAARLSSPRILLIALYHPEHFPLPRFPLGISDLARAARATLTGHVTLLDMQLSITLDDILAAIDQLGPDILGISATFGQHDLMTHLLDTVIATPAPPLLLAGGSLTARNERLLLQRYPTLLIARGAGEATIGDVLAYWHGDLNLSQIRGIAYAGAPHGAGTLGIGTSPRHTAAVPNRAGIDFLPELDLLDRTFAHHGVAQLESSRGCTSYCSFCPRGHKGTWAGGIPAHLQPVLAAMSSIFDHYPAISRTIYLVDEEFIGRDADAPARARTVGHTLHMAGFTWETSARIDQVTRSDADRDWHIERTRLWRDLAHSGLRRCLFGVESGVTSILDRFNKGTTAEQNALAIRTLSALGLPTRFTYITFDHLMTAAELGASYDFLTRTDLLLRPQPHLTAELIVDGVRDDAFAATNTTGRPLYTAVSYLLVSMECLIGAAYTRAVQAAGLTGQVRPSLGRIDAEFRDPRIGACSAKAQLWVDRNFALDYTLKSLEKILDGPPRHIVRNARFILKTAAMRVLADMLDQLGHWTSADPATTEANLNAMLDHRFDELKNQMATTIAQTVPALPTDAADVLTVAHSRWNQPKPWSLINAADTCTL
jgi:hypothetical protein